MGRLLRGAWLATRGLLVLINNIYCIPTYVLWMFLLRPLKWFAPKLFWTLEGVLFHWLLTMVAYWSHSASYEIVESGDSVDDIVGEETLILVNHQSTSDVPLIMAAFASRQHILPNLNWIMDAVFKYTNFGVVSAIHGDFFINAGRDKRDASIMDLVRYLKTCFVPRERKWLVLFPEGGFLRKRKEASNRYCRRMGYPQLYNVTLPRMGAIQAILETIGPKSYNTPNHTNDRKKHRDSRLKWIVDMTIAYPGGKPLDLVAIVTGCAPPCQVHFHYRVYPIHQVPQGKRDFQDWVYSCYTRKERMLENYYKSGIWEAESHPVEQDVLGIFILHAFFILSTTFHIIMFQELGKLLF